MKKVRVKLVANLVIDNEVQPNSKELHKNLKVNINEDNPIGDEIKEMFNELQETVVEQNCIDLGLYIGIPNTFTDLEVNLMLLDDDSLDEFIINNELETQKILL